METLLVQAVYHFDGGEYPEHAVIAPGVAHGIQMRAEQHRLRPFPRAFVASTDIAHAVLPDGHARLAHPLPDQLVGLQMLRGKIDPRQRIRGFANGGQRVGARHHPLCRRAHCGVSRR